MRTGSLVEEPEAVQTCFLTELWHLVNERSIDKAKPAARLAALTSIAHSIDPR